MLSKTVHKRMDLYKSAE